MIQTMILNDLACPAEVDAKPCRGRLALDESSIPAIRFPVNFDEIIEGILSCQTCGQAYPILAGLRILIVQPWIYVRDNYDVILALTAEAGQPISKEMVAAFRDASPEIGYTGKSGGKYDQRDILSTYLDNVRLNRCSTFAKTQNRWYGRGMTQFPLVDVIVSTQIAGGCLRKRWNFWARSCTNSGSAFDLASEPARAIPVSMPIGIGEAN